MIIDKYKISEELDYLLASYSFRNKPQIQRLLTYLVEHAYDEGESAYDQRAIAIECLGRNGEFDPAENPVVRIEMGRLRRLLNHFYSEEPSRSLVFTIPLGQYRPVVSIQSASDSKKIVPELLVSPAKPESLSLLLQFETDGEERSDLYLLRHQVRIGLTVNLGKLGGVRLVVALPDEEGKITSHVDFIVRVSVGHAKDGFQLFYSVVAKESGAVLFREKIELAKNYNNHDLSALINLWGADLLDREVGLLWVEWVRLRSQAEHSYSLRVQALVNYQRYLLNETTANLEVAFFSILSVQREDTDDKMMNAALAELYYRMVINGYGIVADPISDGLLHVRTALRTNPACIRLHLILGFMMFFTKEYQVAEIELGLCLEKAQSTFSFKFHMLILSVLMSGFVKGVDQLGVVCKQAGVYPQLYAVVLYLQAMLTKKYSLATELVQDLDKEGSLPIIHQFIMHMKLPPAWAFEGGREQLREDVLQHLSYTR